MFPFTKKAPPSRVEVAKKAVSDAAHSIIDAVPTELIEDKIDDLKKSAVGAALHAAQVAHHASEVASHKLEELQHAAGALGEAATGVAHRVTHSAHDAGEGAVAAAAAKAKAAREAAHSTKESLQDKVGLLAGSAVALKSALHDRVSHDVEAGKERAHEVKEDAEEAAHDTANAGKSWFFAKKAEVEDRVDDVELPSVTPPSVDMSRVPTWKNGGVEVEYSDSGSKWAWILLGLAVGALVALLFAPTSGRRSRAAIKDRLGKVTSGAADASKGTADKVVDIAHRVEGIAHKVETKLLADAEADDDSIVSDRVRSALGHLEAAKTIERINVDSSNGVVTLRGPVVDQATQDTIVAAVKAIPGVKDVVAEFLIDNPVDPANSVA